MSVTRHKRQIFLFLVAILAPAGALIGLAGRLMYEDRELAAKRALDQQRDAVNQLRRELSSRLEAIKLQEINRLMRLPDSSGTRASEDPAVVFTASLDNDRLVFPWEATTSRGEPASREFAQHRQAGETQEFVQKDYAAAAQAYGLALASARSAGERGEELIRWDHTPGNYGGSAARPQECQLSAGSRGAARIPSRSGRWRAANGDR